MPIGALLKALRVEEGAQRGRVVVAPRPRLEGRRGWAGEVGHIRDRPPQHDDLGELVEGDEAGQVGILAQLAQDVGMVAELLLFAAQDVQPGGAMRVHCHLASPLPGRRCGRRFSTSRRSGSGGCAAMAFQVRRKCQAVLTSRMRAQAPARRPMPRQRRDTR